MRSILNKLRRLLHRFFRKSSTLNRQSLNVASLIVVALIDIFILFNVFIGLNDISSWYLNPERTYPCYSQWQEYRTNNAPGKDYAMVRRSITQPADLGYGAGLASDADVVGIRAGYQRAEIGHLGKVASSCLDYAGLQDALRTPENQKIITTIETKLEKISKLESSSRIIRQQYDSTLLEKVAGQASTQSINNVSAEKAKQKIEANNTEISQLKQEITELKKTLINQPQTAALLNQLQNQAGFDAIAKDYRHAAFWYPSIQLGFQALFLLPLIFIAQAVHRFALRKNYGLVALISWHLLIISVIPALLKLFEFLQVGALFQWIATTIATIFGGLLFLVSYIQILVIPLAGFALIKLIQRLSKSTKSPQLQASSRILESRCLRCAKKIRPQDAHCSHCGYQQYDECPTCHSMTHRHMPHCTHCGAETHFDPALKYQ
jgi:ABC-type multidrug transport system fused ATPase/permease subunit